MLRFRMFDVVTSWDLLMNSRGSLLCIGEVAAVDGGVSRGGWLYLVVLVLSVG